MGTCDIPTTTHSCAMEPTALDLHSLAVLINRERACGAASDLRYMYAKLREILDTSGGIFSQPTQICFLIRLNGILCFPLNMISPQSDLEGSLAGIGVEELETSSGGAGP